MQREVRERKKKKEDEREREEEREEVPLLWPPTLPPVIVCADISLRRRHHLKAWNSRGIAAVTCDQPFFFFKLKG